MIKEYRKSIVYSEAEVRSKLAVPLIECLGFPSALRAEEFPIYGYAGGKRLPAKPADFLLFSNREFNNHREFNQNDIDWVYNHSLLVVETKRPEEFPKVQGQAVYYSTWARALAYLVTDGEQVLGRFYNSAAADYEVVRCTIDELPESLDLVFFSYEALLEVKQTALTKPSYLTSTNVHNAETGQETGVVITSEEQIDLPDYVYKFIREYMGTSVDGMDNLQAVSRFLHFMDDCLKDDFKYGVPLFMLGPIVDEDDALLYIDGKTLPICAGKISHFLRENNHIYVFSNEYMCVLAVICDEALINFSIICRVFDMRVSMRLHHFETVKKIQDADAVRIAAGNKTKWSFLLPIGNALQMHPTKQDINILTQSYIESLEKLLLIEEYYQVEFCLDYIAADKVQKLYDDIDHVYDGIVMRTNCSIVFSVGVVKEDFKFKEPTLFQSQGEINLSDRVLFGKVFTPKETYIMPCNVNEVKPEDDLIVLDGCCRYQLCENNERVSQLKQLSVE